MELKLLPSTFITILTITINIPEINSARILAIIPMASYSHQMFYQQIWRELALRGHDMVVVTTDPTGENLPNFKEIDVKETYGPMKQMINASINESVFTLFFTNRMLDLMNDILKFQFNLPQMQSLIHNETEHFDLVMAEHYAQLHMVFKHKFKCPLIGIMSMDAFPMSHDLMGNPTHTILYPTSMLPFQEDLNIFQRTAAFVFGLAVRCMLGSTNEGLQQNTKEIFGDGIPDVMDLITETDMLFVNANPLFSATRPFTPSTINLAGGIHMKQPEPLPKDLQTFLDKTHSPNGVVYFSLGSNVKSKELSPELRQIIVNTLSELPYNVLWKFEDDNLPGKPENVKIIKWAPQQDILRHPNVKLFITQGGIQSLEESLYSHVPLVVMPFMGDQEANAMRVKSKGLGLMLDPYSLTVETFKAAIFEVMVNTVYRDNIKEFAARIQDEPMTPLEKAIWWTEYVLRHNGAQHLKGPIIPFWQFYYLDILAVLLAVCVVLSGIVFGVVKLLIKGVKKLGKKKTIVGVKKNKKNQ